jgi:hypothetical protein
MCLAKKFSSGVLIWERLSETYFTGEPSELGFTNELFWNVLPGACFSGRVLQESFPGTGFFGGVWLRHVSHPCRAVPSISCALGRES